jgi:opine dehydrogenase
VFLQSLADQIGVETPYISAVIRLVSLLMERDYLAQGKRTMETLGLSGLSVEELKLLLT